MDEDFDLKGVDIQLIHAFGHRNVVLLDGGKLHGGVLNQKQSDAEGTGKEDEKGEDARHNFSPETRTHPVIVGEAKSGFERRIGWMVAVRR